MNEVVSVADRNGQLLQVGDNVRVLSVTLDRNMDDDERDMIEFMIGSVCPIEGIDAEGRAWVTMWWSTGEGTASSSVGLAPEQMERAE